MKLLYAFLILITTGSHAQTLVMTDETSDISFHTTHLLGRLEGNFKGVQGTIIFNPNNLLHSHFKLIFAASTITTNDQLVGPNLIRKACFDAGRYPAIELTSDSITRLANENLYLFKGSLKVKGIAKPIAFRFAAKANAAGYDFNFRFAIKRKNYLLHCGATGKKLKVFVRAYAKRVDAVANK